MKIHFEYEIQFPEMKTISMLKLMMEEKNYFQKNIKYDIMKNTVQNFCNKNYFHIL